MNTLDALNSALYPFNDNGTITVSSRPLGDQVNFEVSIVFNGSRHSIQQNVYFDRSGPRKGSGGQGNVYWTRKLFNNLIISMKRDGVFSTPISDNPGNYDSYKIQCRVGNRMFGTDYRVSHVVRRKNSKVRDRTFWLRETFKRMFEQLKSEEKMKAIRAARA